MLPRTTNLSMDALHNEAADRARHEGSQRARAEAPGVPGDVLWCPPCSLAQQGGWLHGASRTQIAVGPLAAPWDKQLDAPFAQRGLHAVVGWVAGGWRVLWKCATDCGACQVGVRCPTAVECCGQEAMGVLFSVQVAGEGGGAGRFGRSVSDLLSAARRIDPAC